MPIARPLAQTSVCLRNILNMGLMLAQTSSDQSVPGKDLRSNCMKVIKWPPMNISVIFRMIPQFETFVWEGGKKHARQHESWTHQPQGWERWALLTELEGHVSCMDNEDSYSVDFDCKLLYTLTNMCFHCYFVVLDSVSWRYLVFGFLGGLPYLVRMWGSFFPRVGG